MRNRRLVSSYSLVALAMLVLSGAMVLVLSGAQEPVSAQGDPAWSRLVGADYAYQGECQTNIENHLDLTQPGLPIPPDASNNLTCLWDIFAWNSFASLNWPANKTLGKRGLPTKESSFLENKENGAELVWEAFKEKRELFQEDFARHWNDIEGGQEVLRFAKPSNLWKSYDGYCSAEDRAKAATSSSGPFALDKFHNQLDETAEVQSQALESLEDLCGGRPASCLTSGEITNESVVGPRVYQGKASQGRPIYYEVKVNYDFFDYVVNPPPNLFVTQEHDTLVTDEVAATNAILGRLTLPWRSSAKNVDRPNPRKKEGYDPSPTGSDCNPYDGNPDPTLIGSSDPAQFVPCRVGAVHMKSAWLKLEQQEIDDGRYHTTSALYYEDAPPASDAVDVEAQKCIAVDTFGLLGLHAIQRVKNSSADNPGGAFVFATWEHRSIYNEKTDPPYDYGRDFEYVNLLVETFNDDQAGAAYPTLDSALSVTRMVPDGMSGQPGQTTCGLSAEQTCQVNAKVREKLKDTVWVNYRLVGTQFQASNCDFDESGDVMKQLSDCRKTSLSEFGQPQFLANAVIETNQGLQHFLGLPPGQPRFQPAQWCADSATNSDYCDNQGGRLVPPNSTGLTSFLRGHPNIVYNADNQEKTALNMGGCQGCHGVAQQNGYSFSFVLLDGQGGADADTQDDTKIPATNLSGSVPVKLQWVGDPTKGLKATTQTSAGHYNVGVVDLAEADTWQVQPYFTGKSTGNFPGQFSIFHEATGGLLTLGIVRTGLGPVQGTGPHTVLIVPPTGQGTSRAVLAQLLYLVKYQGPPHEGTSSLPNRYNFVSLNVNGGSSGGGSEVHYLLTVSTDQTTTTSIAPYPPPPQGTTASGTTKTQLESQAFNLLIVDAKGG